MHKILYFTLVLSSILLASCGDDVGSNKPENKTPGSVTTGATADSLPVLRSFMNRVRGTTQISTGQEITNYRSNTLPGYRTIPSMLLDDEGSSANVVTVTSLGRPTVTCGTAATFINIDQRIADCASKNSAKASWNGTLNGASGEGNWRLVAIDTNLQEVWIDDSTGLVWSAALPSANWCRASGNQETVTENCEVLGEVEASCATTDTSLNIKWRLPTRNDFLQADLDGSRFVLSGGSFWTATLDSKSSGRAKAWVYSQSQGLLASESITTLKAVRCVGAPLRQ